MQILKFSSKPSAEDILQRAPTLAGREVTVAELNDGSFVVITNEGMNENAKQN
jgi:hypothetical protein